MKKILLWLGLLASLASTLYCFIGYVMYVWLGATPNYPRDIATFGSLTFLIGTIVFFLSTLVFSILLWKIREK